MKLHAQTGFSLLETIFAVGLLSVGALGMAGIFAQGMQKTISSPGELLATQKAAEAIESVFSARDSHTLVFNQLRNISAAPLGTPSVYGIFKDGPQPMTMDGPDGVLGTADDPTAIESVTLPGQDQLLGTADDVVQKLDTFTREIKITDVSLDLRQITVTITYKAGSVTRSYTLTSLISNFA